MKKTLLTAFAFVAALIAVGCGNPCNDLDCAACDNVASPGLTLACDLVVAADDADSCNEALDSAAFDSCR